MFRDIQIPAEKIHFFKYREVIQVQKLRGAGQQDMRYKDPNNTDDHQNTKNSCIRGWKSLPIVSQTASTSLLFRKSP